MKLWLSELHLNPLVRTNIKTFLLCFNTKVWVIFQNKLNTSWKLGPKFKPEHLILGVDKLYTKPSIFVCLPSSDTLYVLTGKLLEQKVVDHNTVPE